MYNFFKSLAIAIILVAACENAFAQNCNALTPSGGDDAVFINNCLATQGSATLTANTFLIFQPITAIQMPNRSLIGAGKNLTKIIPQFSCGDPRFVNTSDNSYKIPLEIRRSDNSVVRDFTLELKNLTRTCGHKMITAVSVNRSPGTTLENLKIIGSRYGTVGYTTGWGSGRGIHVQNSENTTVRNTNVADLGFSGSFAGNEAIRIESSGNSLIENNDIHRVSFGIEVVNSTPAAGFTGDSSGTIVRNNIIQGASLIGCPDCSNGRAMKFFACGTGTEPPLRNLTVTGNSATEYGGQINGQFAGFGGAGLWLECGVTYSRFESNSFTNAPFAEVGFFVNSIPFPPSGVEGASHHNTFMFNHFEGGNCSNCFDVWFGPKGPDQNGISKNNLGNNTVGRGTTRDDAGNQCSTFGSAWFQYPSGQNFINRGQNLLVAGTGIRPPSFFAVITFRFKNSSGVEVATYQTQRSQSNCVVNQENVFINPAVFAPGLYTVTAEYYDGTAPDLFIKGDPIGTLDVR
jgi:hypothetical protein